jgi:hypothetical protein
MAHVALYLEDALTRAGLAVDGFLDATLVPDLPAEVGELFLGVLRSGQILVTPAAFDLLGGWDALEAGWVSAWNTRRIGVGMGDGTRCDLPLDLLHTIRVDLLAAAGHDGVLLLVTTEKVDCPMAMKWEFEVAEESEGWWAS